VNKLQEKYKNEEKTIDEIQKTIGLAYQHNPHKKAKFAKELEKINGKKIKEDILKLYRETKKEWLSLIKNEKIKNIIKSLLKEIYA